MKKFTLTLLSIFTFLISNAQESIEMADQLRSEGKIYVVVAVLVVILIGLFIYLFTIDKKVRQLEKEN
ncbi:CcmD family protein [Acidiluteibacter ferrifornacis]|uniref:CcmD family protein n=1 Tax=Acidiluteibacter ferrifornacis TaxID=2692424 RepID=A0A6N9NP55_9FLAO|nr:CcmD family protein [Acidiluteibacter ferrifornacis]NBG66285.1 CcmD family protein [Acidiluteibacter ferrifornacis]